MKVETKPFNAWFTQKKRVNTSYLSYPLFILLLPKHHIIWLLTMVFKIQGKFLYFFPRSVAGKWYSDQWLFFETELLLLHGVRYRNKV